MAEIYGNLVIVVILVMAGVSIRQARRGTGYGNGPAKEPFETLLVLNDWKTVVFIQRN